VPFLLVLLRELEGRFVDLAPQLDRFDVELARVGDGADLRGGQAVGAGEILLRDTPAAR
jgi:hypothetical protein